MGNRTGLGPPRFPSRDTRFLKSGKPIALCVRPAAGTPEALGSIRPSQSRHLLNARKTLVRRVIVEFSQSVVNVFGLYFARTNPFSLVIVATYMGPPTVFVSELRLWRVPKSK